MLNDDLVELLGDYLAETYRAVDKHYLELIGKQIKEIGTVTPSKLHQLEQMMRTGANVKIIQEEIAAVTGKNAEDIAKILDTAAQSAYGDASPYYEAEGISQATLAQNPAILDTVRAIERATLGTFANLSQTTVIRESYSKAIDGAVAAVQSGVTDYDTAIRQTLRETAKEGLRVKYASGHTRRLDSAARQNVLDGVRAVNQGVRDEAGRQFGADGVEISAHGVCAADHEPFQGRQYSDKEFADIQSGLHRQIGTWNCGHAIFPIILGVSSPAYSKQELKEIYDDNHAPVTYDGKTYATKYEASQEQRRMETSIRYGEDMAHLADAAGDTTLAAEYRAKLKTMNKGYRDFSNTAGLQTRRERITAARQRFTGGGERGIMQSDGERMTALPGADKAIIPDSKISGYALNINHATGKNKAIAFERALGYNQGNADALVSAIRGGLPGAEVRRRGNSKYGSKFEAVMNITGPNGKTAKVKTGWLVDAKMGNTRLTTVYVDD